MRANGIGEFIFALPARGLAGLVARVARRLQRFRPVARCRRPGDAGPSFVADVRAEDVLNEARDLLARRHSRYEDGVRSARQEAGNAA